MELIISIALLGIIMAAVMTLFMIGIKNYRRESQRNFMQKEINFTADDLGMQIKQATDSPATYDVYTRGPETLVLALPSINADGDFLYYGSELLKDYVIYYLQNSSIHKKIVSDPSSSRSPRESTVLNDVSSFNCLYTPPAETEIIECTIMTSKSISGTNLNFSAVKTAGLRNRR